MTLPRAKKTGPRSASQADSVASECASSEASIPLGGDATRFRKSLQLEEVTTNQRKVDNGAVTGDTKQEEALSRLTDVSVQAEAMTELGVKEEQKNVDMHMAAEQMFVPPLPPDSAKKKSTKSETLSQSWCAQVRPWKFWECCLSDQTKSTCDGVWCKDTRGGKMLDGEVRFGKDWADQVTQISS